LAHPLNAALAEALAETATLLELGGESPFKARAFRNAARTIDALPDPAGDLLASGELGSVKGIGKGILQAVAQYLERGAIDAAEAMRAELPEVAFEMLGPSKVRALLAALEIRELGDLEAACLENRLLGIKGFGARSQQRILDGLRFLGRNRGRHRLGTVLDVARALEESLARLPSAEGAALTGSARRRCEVVGDVDLVVATADAARTVSEATELLTAGRAAVEHREATRLAGRLPGGIPFEAFLVPPGAYGAALVVTTGSAGHLDKLRARAEVRGLVLGPDGLRRARSRVAAEDEAAVYAALELPWIPPELREGADEVEAAAAGELPALIELADLRGCLHVHSTWSDGANSLEEIARHARSLGLEYVGIADHSRSAAYAGGLSAERLAAQGEEIAALNRRGVGARLLRGVESDILADGSLDYPDEVLARLDFVVGSIHSGLRMDRTVATARVLKALKHPRLTLLGHPTGRLLLDREGYELDWPAVFSAAAAGGKVIEINAHPSRLDLDWRQVRPAIAAGVKLAVSPDAHDLEGFAHLQYGIDVARKGWARAEDVINTHADPLQ
jgi:DNA polymerase (family 10)